VAVLVSRLRRSESAEAFFCPDFLICPDSLKIPREDRYRALSKRLMSFLGRYSPASSPEAASPPPADGFDASFQVIYTEHASAIYYLALRLLGEPSLAEDVTHDVFIKAFRALDTFRGDSSIRTWLYQITLNHCRNHRAAWHQRTMVTNTDEILDGCTSPSEAGPIRVLETKELGERIRATLDQLLPDQRLVLLLAADEQLSYDEIALITDQSPDSVRGKLHRARKAFAQRFPKTA
jgi:RNA polymerase sigma-70 factor (ECF subfamily)